MQLSVNQTCLGKNSQTIGNDAWRRASFSARALLEWNYLQGRAIAPGLFAHGERLSGKEKTHKNNRLWVGSELVFIDIDHTSQSRAQLLANDFIARYCFAMWPSSSYTPDKAKWHLAFALDRELEDRSTWSDVVSVVNEALPIEADTAMATASQGLYGTIFVTYKGRKALDDGLCYLNEGAEKLNSTELIGAIAPKGINFLGGRDKARAQRDSASPHTAKRTQLHAKQKPEMRERVVLEALTYALRGWGELDYKSRLPLILAAHAGCNSVAVFEAFLLARGNAWQQSATRENFGAIWEEIEDKSDGYTVATLFMLARAQGWLQHTSVEVKRAESFYASEVGDWLPSAPKRAVLISGIGTGKTQAAIALIKGLSKPKALFFAPTIKLCMALYKALTNAGVEATLYIEGTKTKDREALLSAQVLVTTLQTFATKVVAKDVDISLYRVAIFDESDDLFGSFAMAGARGFCHGGHINKAQSHWGYFALQQILQKVEYVYALDATATRVTSDTMSALAGEVIPVFKNTYKRRKAPVTMLHTIHQARAVAAKGVADGLRVVIATDTKREATAMKDHLKNMSVKRSSIMLITGETHTSGKVQRFFADVEAGAKEYKIIIYNSAMGSGVSIVDTKPDLIVQVATHLVPRHNLQMLGRFRNQAKVFCYIQGREDLYSVPIEQRLKMFKAALVHDEDFLEIPYAERTTLTQVAQQAAMLAVTDFYEQRRNARDFYARLLRDDGREVIFEYEDLGLTKLELELFVERFKKAFEAIKQRKRFVLENWRSIEPIDHTTGEVDELEDDEIACGLLHAYMLRHWNDKFDELEAVTDLEAAQLTLQFGKKSGSLIEFSSGDFFGRALSDRQKEERQLVASRLHWVKYDLVHLLDELFCGHHHVTQEAMAERAPHFLGELKARRLVYDALAGKRDNFWEDVEEAPPVTGAYRAARHIARLIGLRFKKVKGQRDADGKRPMAYGIAERDSVLTYLSLKGYNQGIEFNRKRFYERADEARLFARNFIKLPTARQKQIVEQVAAGFGVNALDEPF